jgi:hypothetical protein
LVDEPLPEEVPHHAFGNLSEEQKIPEGFETTKRCELCGEKILELFMEEHTKVEHGGQAECPICNIKVSQVELNDHVQAHEVEEKEAISQQQHSHRQAPREHSYR